MSSIADEIAALFKQKHAQATTAAAEKHAAEMKRADAHQAQAEAVPRRAPAGPRDIQDPAPPLRGSVAVSPSARPGGAAPVAPMDSGSGGPGWQPTAPGDKIGYNRVATGPTPTVVSLPPKQPPKQQSSEDFNVMMRDFQQAHESGRDVR
jgi:hypothetical protein